MRPQEERSSNIAERVAVVGSRMFTVAVFTTLVAGHAMPLQEPLPQNSTFLYSGIPGIEGPRSRSVRMVWHDVNVHLSKAYASIDSVTLFRNESRRSARVNLKLPVDLISNGRFMGRCIEFSAALDGAPLSLHHCAGDPMKPSLPFDPPIREVRCRTAEVVFRARRDHALRVHYRVPMGEGGLAAMERMIGYETSGAKSWRSNVHEVNFAVHYDPDVVFRVNTALPAWHWQVGDKGAYFKRVSFQPNGDTLTRFVFYRGGFDPIGR